MLKTRIIAAALALTCTTGTVGAVAQSTLLTPTLEQTIEICQVVTREALKTNNPSLVNDALAFIVPEARKPVSVVCYAYTVGYQDGVNDGKQSQ